MTKIGKYFIICIIFFQYNIDSNASDKVCKIIEWDNKWVSCQNNNDCLATEGICNSWTSINKNFVSEFECYNQFVVVDCSIPPENEKKKPTVSCYKNKCTTSYDLHRTSELRIIKENK